MENQPAAGGVQSVQRAFDLLELIAEAGGSQGISQLSASSGLPVPTIHRLLRTLVAQGYLRQDSSRRYALGPRLIRLGDMASRALGGWARPLLTRLVEATGETANLAILDGGEIMYVAQVASPHAMRMFTEPGRRVLAHCTAVGKALLAELPDAEVRALTGRTGMPAQTARTITDPDTLLANLAEIRAQGFAIDDGEQETGVRCVAVAVPHRGAYTAVSISGPQARVDEATIAAATPLLRAAAAELARHFADADGRGRG